MSNPLESELTRRSFLKGLGKVAAISILANALPSIASADEGEEFQAAESDSVVASTTNTEKETQLPSGDTTLESIVDQLDLPEKFKRNQFAPFFENKIGAPIKPISLHAATYDQTSLRPDTDMHSFNSFAGQKDFILSKHVFNTGDPKTVILESIHIAVFPNQQKFLTNKDVVTAYGTDYTIVSNDDKTEMVYSGLGLSFGWANLANHFGAPEDNHLVEVVNKFQPMPAENYELGLFKAV